MDIWHTLVERFKWCTKLVTGNIWHHAMWRMPYVTYDEMLSMTDHMRVWHGSRLRLVWGKKSICLVRCQAGGIKLKTFRVSRNHFCGARKMMRNHKKSLWSGSNDEITIIQLFPAIYIRWDECDIISLKGGRDVKIWTLITYEGDPHRRDVIASKIVSKVDFKWIVVPWYRDNIMGTKFLARKVQLKRLGGDRYSWILPSLDNFAERLMPKLTIISLSAVFLSSICLINLTFDI